VLGCSATRVVAVPRYACSSRRVLVKREGSIAQTDAANGMGWRWWGYGKVRRTVGGVARAPEEEECLIFCRRYRRSTLIL